MKLKIETVADSNDKITVQREDSVAEPIYLTLSRLGNAITVELSPFEAQTLAEALLKMAESLALSQEITGGDGSELGVIEYPATEPKEMMIKELIRRAGMLADESRETEAYPTCGKTVTQFEKVGRCVYAQPCDCRLWQGDVPVNWRVKPMWK